MNLTIHGFYVAIVIRNSNIICQLCYNQIQVTIISITGLNCLLVMWCNVHCIVKKPTVISLCEQIHIAAKI